MARPCKICKLKKSHPKAYQELTEQILKNEKRTMNKFIESFNKTYGLKIIAMNVSRHKTHMEGNVHELTDKDKRESDSEQKGTVSSGSFLSNTLSTAAFTSLDPREEKMILAYRANGWRNKEEAAKEAGYKSPKKVYEIMKKNEVQAAINELKAIDFINLKITGNQIIAGLGKIATYTDYIEEIYDEEGRLKTNIKEWPDEVKAAIGSIEMTEDVLNNGSDDLPVLRRNYRFRFESSLVAKKELRKHFMEIDMFRLGEEKRRIHDKTVTILNLRNEKKLDLIETMRLFEKEGLPFPESLKLEIRDFDWELEKRIKKAEENARQALSYKEGA